MTNTNSNSPGRGRLAPLIHLSNNWLSLAGVVIVTTATIFWLFLLPTTLRGQEESPYIGILAFLVIPAAFFLGLILIPVGIWWKRKRTAYTGASDLPAPGWRNPELRRLAYFVVATTFVNVVIASETTYTAVNYMDSVGFCGNTCHNVMQPEFTAYKISPHARVECAKCHVGPGASGFVRSKLSGTAQLLAIVFHTYPTPIPTPVRNLRPARETCETCHWPQLYGGNRLQVISKFGDDERNTPTKTVLLMKLGESNGTAGIHKTHLGTGVTIRYAESDRARQTIPWIEYDWRGGKRVYAAPGTTQDGWPIREMDCVDCHNRPTHTFELPERGIDRAMNAGRIAASLPFAKKKAVEIVKAPYASREEAAQKIPAAFIDFYQQKYPQIWSQHREQVAASARAALEVWEENVFPDMKVTWGTYSNNLGHTDFPGCFRCHDGGHTDKTGESITQDCDACHHLLAVDEADPKILTELGVEDTK